MHGVAAGMEREASAQYEVPLKQARFPWVKTLEQFDFGFQPGIDRKVVRELAGLAFVERAQERDPAGSAWCG
ncbi:ATP-binding protein [Escherichia coli]